MTEDGTEIHNHKITQIRCLKSQQFVEGPKISEQRQLQEQTVHSVGSILINVM